MEFRFLLCLSDFNSPFYLCWAQNLFNSVVFKRLCVGGKKLNEFIHIYQNILLIHEISDDNSVWVLCFWTMEWIDR